LPIYRGHRALDARPPPRRARRGLAHPHRRARLHRSVKQAGAPEVGAPAALIAPCAEPGFLAGLKPHPGLDAFRRPEAQHAALVDIAGEERGCVTAAYDPATSELVGDGAFHTPSAVETGADDR